MKKFIRQYPVWSFLIINYFISWTFLYPSYRIIENAGQITPMALIGLVGAYGPTVAALIVQYIIDKNQFKTLIKKLIKVRATFKIIAFVIIAPIVFYCLAYLLSAAVYDEALNFNLVYAISNIPFWFLAALPFGPMGEELGWRGFMLPKLLENNSVYKSTIYVGLAWGIWHLASFTFPGAAIPDFFDVSIGTILLYFLNTIALSFVFTYVYLKTKGSVFYAILLHAFFNAAANITSDFFDEPTKSSFLISAYIVNIILAGLCGLFLIRNYRSEKILPENR